MESQIIDLLKVVEIVPTINVQAISSVYEKLFETSDIMSGAFELCVGHFHFMLENFLFDIKTLDSEIKKKKRGHIFVKTRDILTYPDFLPPWQTQQCVGQFVRHFRPKRRSKTSDIKTSKKGFSYSLYQITAVIFKPCAAQDS